MNHLLHPSFFLYKEILEDMPECFDDIHSQLEAQSKHSKHYAYINYLLFIQQQV